MLFDVRTYTCRPGTIKAQLELYEAEGMTPQKRNLGEPLFYGMCETGNPNQYLHIWVYKDAADRASKRAAMQADPEWQAFLARSKDAGYLESQDNKLFMNAPFFESAVKPK